MVIGTKELLRLVKEKKLVEDLCERELKNPEGAGFDFRLNKAFKLEGDSYLGIEDRKTPKTKAVVCCCSRDK